MLRQKIYTYFAEVYHHAMVATICLSTAGWPVPQAIFGESALRSPSPPSPTEQPVNVQKKTHVQAHAENRPLSLTVGVLVPAVVHALPPDDGLGVVLVDADVRRPFLRAAVFVEEQLAW